MIDGLLRGAELFLASVLLGWILWGCFMVLSKGERDE
jgi:hypothetical protein